MRGNSETALLRETRCLHAPLIRIAGAEFSWKMAVGGLARRGRGLVCMRRVVPVNSDLISEDDFVSHPYASACLDDHGVHSLTEAGV